jgi:FKBP-type peptidyl-prolyl isomerase-like protein
MAAHRIAETVGVGCLLVSAAMLGTTQLADTRAAEAPRVIAHEPTIEIETHVTSVALDACVPRTDSFPSPRAPDDVGHPGGDAVITGSGLRYRPLSMGCGGPTPGHEDVVQVRLAGWTDDGIEIVGIAGEMSLPIRAVVPGFSEGMQLMHVGDRFRLFVPGHLAYGKGMLTFDVELVAIRGTR